MANDVIPLIHEHLRELSGSKDVYNDRLLRTDSGRITAPWRLMTLLREFTDSEIAVLVPHHAPRIFYVNWFRKDNSGRFLWPEFGEKCRALAWIFRRCDGEADAEDTAIGRVPAPEHRLSCG
jgi:hypothetical protein